MRYRWGLGWLGLSLALVSLLGCNGPIVTTAPDYGTPAAETPGPLTPAEEQYIRQVELYHTQLIQLSITLNNTLALGTPVDMEGQQRRQADLSQMRAAWQTAATLPAPPRLQGIDVHYRQALTYYAQALDLYAQELAVAATPVQYSTPLLNRLHEAMDHVEMEFDQLTIYLQGFRVRHP
ncbi:MAG TPA: hypothetical protein VKY74_18155 [Chloroflexia bacterium]|nr:hypothetical protein [Chloroflexia bacterium]